ncbi:hypothetical protein [Streptomyces sp. B21-083]|uniref:hypothetical protein n=1 Tax=Streptomyces sp. B21-083 TaxID=3039410 RepID=UPI002FF413E5
MATAAAGHRMEKDAKDRAILDAEPHHPDGAPERPVTDVPLQDLVLDQLPVRLPDSTMTSGSNSSSICRWRTTRSARTSRCAVAQRQAALHRRLRPAPTAGPRRGRRCAEVRSELLRAGHP